MKVLAVDDEMTSLFALESALLMDGHEVTTASNGKEAFAKLREDGIRMVVSDWMMPEMNGVEFCRRVREAGLSNYVYIILLTSSSGADDVVEGLAAGADDFVKKPFEVSELRMRVRTGQRILSLETRHMAIFSMAKLAESRDPETGAHLERMQAYSRVMAWKMSEHPDYQDQMSLDFVQTVFETAPLHDIGKVGVPDAILRKPGKLTDDEFETMKSHASIGGQTLDATLEQYPDIEYLRIARDIAYCHHEKWDGSGYPRGLAGDEIPLVGRIVALADVYDALTTRRVYKPAFSHEKSAGIIVAGRGKHFDPRIVDAFMELEDDFQAILKSFPAD